MGRILGALAVLGGALLLRAGILARFAAERQALRDLIAALSYLESEIRMTLRPLPQLLERRGLGLYADRFFAEVLAALFARPEEGLAPCWRNACAALPLGEGERDVLIRLADCLDAEEETVLRALHETVERLRDALREQESIRRDRERLTGAVCLCGSVLLLVLLV